MWLRNGWNGGTKSGPWDSFAFAPDPLPDRNRLVDMNRDGRLDAVVGFEAISIQGKLAWYEQPANATDSWREHLIDQIVIGPMSVDVQDMDQDGDWDVVVGEHNLADPSSARLLIYENLDGNGIQWQAHTVHIGDEHHDGAHVVDIDNDGDFDILSIGWRHNRVILYENQSAPCGSVPPTPTDIPAPTGTPASTATATVTNTPAPIATETPLPPTATPTPIGTCVDDDTNAIRNGGFESGNANWSFYTSGGGNFTLTTAAYECSQAAQLQFNGAGNNMQFYQSGITLEP
ncbi:MAG: VCBS repeat-containing protein, partial [Caldilineaceae bacterium]|nr:VCBS repeat-containing protein [Caldilineaceae bacterium]